MSHFCCSEDHRQSSANWQQLEEGRRRQSITSGDFLSPHFSYFYISSHQTAAFCCYHTDHHARGVHVTYQWPGPSHQPDLLRPTPEKLHQQNLSTERKSPGVRCYSDRISEKSALVPKPLPDMNSNRMSLSSFLEFLSLRTRLMGTLVLAAAGSYNEFIRQAYSYSFTTQDITQNIKYTCQENTAYCHPLTWPVETCAGLPVWAGTWGGTSSVWPMLGRFSRAAPGGCRCPVEPSDEGKSYNT